MNMEEKREILRKHLQSGYKKINNLNARIRKVKATKGLVMLKRDKMLRQMKEELSQIHRTIEDMKIRFEQDLEGLVEEKVSELDSEVDEVQEDIFMLMEICLESEKILKLGNEQLLEIHSKALVSSFEMLFETDECLVDYEQMIFMDFKPYNISDTLIKKGLGYIITRENDNESVSNFMISVATQVGLNDLTLRRDMATQTVRLNQRVWYPPFCFGDPALNNPQSVLVAPPNYSPYNSGRQSYYLSNHQLMPAACNYPMNVNQNNFPVPPFLGPTLRYGYLPQVSNLLQETNQPNISHITVSRQTTHQSGSQELVTKETMQPTVYRISGRPKLSLDENEAEAYIPKLNRPPRFPYAETIERLSNSTTSNNEEKTTEIKNEVKSKTACYDFSNKAINEEKLTGQSLVNESWDEEVVSLPEHHQIPIATCQQEIVKKEAITESKVVSQYPSWDVKVADQRNSQTAPLGDSGTSPDIKASDKLDKDIIQEVKKPTLKPTENKSTGRQPTIFKSEIGISKTIDITQFKSLFEKHIESNDNVPQSGHMVGTGSSYHIDRSDNVKAETQKPKEKQADKNTNLCICTLIYKQSNWKEIKASLVYKAGEFGQGAVFAETLSFPIGVAVNSKNEVIVNDTSNHLVKVFRKDVLVNVMGLEDIKMQRPSAIVVNKNDDLFVKDNCAIYVFDKYGKYKYSFGKDTLKQPYGLVMTEDETLLVLDTQRPAPCLYEFHQEGRMLSCHPYQPLEKSHSTSKCRFMAYHGGKLLVSDLGRSMLYLTNRKGELMHQFSRFGNGDCKFNEPSGVTVDSDGHWIVADSKNHRVQVLKPNGEFISVIKFDEPVIRPSDIHWTDDGQLVIVDFLAHSLKVFQLDKT